MVYDYFVDPTDSWNYKGNQRWDYNKVLKVGEESRITLFFFVKTNKVGLLYNTVFVGNNQTNETEYSTNHTNVTKHNDTFDDNETNKTKTNKTVHKHHKTRIDKNATGNPLYALTLVLTTLGVITSKRRK